jgi:hypothetical protein
MFPVPSPVIMLYNTGFLKITNRSEASAAYSKFFFQNSELHQLFSALIEARAASKLFGPYKTLS